MNKISNRKRNCTIKPVGSLNVQVRLRSTFRNVSGRSVLVPQQEAGKSNRGLTKRVMPWLVRLVAGFSSGMRGFHPLPVNVRFVVDKLAMGQAFICDYFTGFPVSIIPQMLHDHLLVNINRIRRTSGRRLGTYQEGGAFSDILELWSWEPSKRQCFFFRISWMTLRTGEDTVN